MCIRDRDTTKVQMVPRRIPARTREHIVMAVFFLLRFRFRTPRCEGFRLRIRFLVPVFLSV